MPTCDLSVWQLMLSGLLVIALAGVALRQSLGLARSLIWNACRCVGQLLLIGLVLKLIFDSGNGFWVLAMVIMMVAVAGYEIESRQKLRFKGGWGYWIGTGGLLGSSVAVALFTLAVVLQFTDAVNAPSPWYQARYAIPLVGMILGNTMTGIALGVDRIVHALADHKAVIEQRLLLGETPVQIIAFYRKEAVRAAMIPTINTMAVTGVVSLPGMMTGQILAGNEPFMAAKYQILIMFLIAAGTGFGTILSTAWAARHLFDERMRLRLDRLSEGKK